MSRPNCAAVSPSACFSAVVAILEACVCACWMLFVTLQLSGSLKRNFRSNAGIFIHLSLASPGLRLRLFEETIFGDGLVTDLNSFLVFVKIFACFVYEAG